MANTLKFGGGTWATKKGSTLAYNDENEKYKPLPFNFERDSIATRVNKKGLIEVVSNNIPRIDYKDSAEGVLLLEKAATNYSVYSELPSTWTYTEFGSGSAGTITTGKTDMFGGTNAVQIDFPSNAENVGIRFGSATSGLSSGNCNISIYVKLVESGSKNLQLRAGFKDIVNVNSTEFTRVDVSGTKSNNEAFNLKLRPSEGTSTGGFSIIVCHPQEENNSHATSYIPTSGSTVQRAAETANGSGNSEVFNDSEGVLFADILPSTFTDVAPNYYKFISLSDGTPTNRLILGITSSSKLSINMITSGGNTSFTEKNISKQNLKVAINWDANYLTVYLNGFQFSTPLSVVSNFAENTLNRLNFNTPNTYPFYGKTKELGYYDTALTDEELEYMTSYRSLNELVTELNLNTL